MLVREDGNDTAFSERQFSNAYSQISVTLDGTITRGSASQSAKAM